MQVVQGRFVVAAAVIDAWSALGEIHGSRAYDILARVETRVVQTGHAVETGRILDRRSRVEGRSENVAILVDGVGVELSSSLHDEGFIETGIESPSFDYQHVRHTLLFAHVPDVLRGAHLPERCVQAD